MAMDSREIVRRMRDGVRPVGFVLGLAAIIGAGQHWLMAIAEFPDDSNWIFLALPLMALLVTTLLYAPAVLLHALGTRAVGEAPPFLASCKAALRALPALGFVLCFVIFAAYTVASYTVEWVPLEYLSVTRLVTGQFGGTGEAALNTLDQAFLMVLLVYTIWYVFALLVPACSVLSRDGLIAAYQRQHAWTQSTDGREMLMFLPVTVVAVALFFASPRALLEALTATEIPGILVFIIRSMTLQLAVALLFAATIPWWKREHERAIQTV